MKYELFYGYVFYPIGGYDDYVGDFDSIDAAKARAIELQKEDGNREAWVKVYDQNKKLCIEGTYEIVIDEDYRKFKSEWTWNCKQPNGND